MALHYLFGYTLLKISDFNIQPCCLPYDINPYFSAMDHVHKRDFIQLPNVFTGSVKSGSVNQVLSSYFPSIAIKIHGKESQGKLTGSCRLMHSPLLMADINLSLIITDISFVSILFLFPL